MMTLFGGRLMLGNLLKVFTWPQFSTSSNDFLIVETVEGSEVVVRKAVLSKLRNNV